MLSSFGPPLFAAHPSFPPAGFLQLGVSTYGGGLWHTWFDRDLAIAGRVIVRTKTGALEHRLVHLNKPVCRVPSLAIHLDRSVSEKFVFNTETNLLPVLASVTKGVLEGSATPQAGVVDKSAHHPILLKALAAELRCDVEDICDFELCLCDHQPATIGGVAHEFIFAPRLDNLLSCWVALQAFLKALPTLERDDRTRVISFFDHEECGSDSRAGAGSDLLARLLERIDEALCPAGVAYGPNLHGTSLHNSFMISADMAHAVHPNYADKHEANHKVRERARAHARVGAPLIALCSRACTAVSWSRPTPTSATRPPLSLRSSSRNWRAKGIAKSSRLLSATTARAAPPLAPSPPPPLASALWMWVQACCPCIASASSARPQTWTSTSTCSRTFSRISAPLTPSCALIETGRRVFVCECFRRRVHA